jgi:putative DNA primase/helicase
MSKVLDFPPPVISSEERAVRRLNEEVARLVRLPTVEWMFWCSREDHAREHGVTTHQLRQMVEKVLNERQRQHERAQKEAQKEAERKQRAREKEFKAIAKMPRATAETRLADMAKREDVDEETLVTEFAKATSGAGAASIPSGSESFWEVEPWPEPVTTADLLDGIEAKVRKHVALRPQQVTAVSLWTAYDWLHDRWNYSTFLFPTSEEEDSGKSTLMSVLNYLVKHGFYTGEPNGPNVYRTIDAYHPTFIVDEASKLFRKADVHAIINLSWQRGPKITRGGYEFDIYCPKIIGILGLGKTSVPRDTLSRGLHIKMRPAKEGEIEEEFQNQDDNEFLELRRKLARWSADSGEAIAKIKPTSDFLNRTKTNWKPLLAIAEHAGEEWAKKARDAAEFLSRGSYEPSWAVRLMAEMDALFQKQPKDTPIEKLHILSETLVSHLLSDLFSPWHDYKTAHRFGAITERQIAALLKPRGINPTTIHPTGRADLTRRAYLWINCHDTFERYRNRFDLIEDLLPQSEQPPQPEQPKPRPNRKLAKPKAPKGR